MIGFYWYFDNSRHLHPILVTQLSEDLVEEVSAGCGVVPFREIARVMTEEVAVLLAGIFSGEATAFSTRIGSRIGSRSGS